MLTIFKEEWLSNERDSNGAPLLYIQGVCLSSDTKPTNVDNGSVMLEMDTSSMFVYDRENTTWRRW